MLGNCRSIVRKLWWAFGIVIAINVWLFFCTPFYDLKLRSTINSATKRSVMVSKAINHSVSNEKSTTRRADDPKCGYLVIKWTIVWETRLGNGMFEYASFYGLVKYQETRAKKEYFITVNDVSLTVDGIFENLALPQRNVSNEWWVQQRFNQQGWPPCCRYDKAKMDEYMCDGKNVTPGGYWQSYKYFINYFNDIKREFTFSSSIRRKSRELMETSLASIGMKRNESIVVGVHARRGDFASAYEQFRGRIPATIDYLQRAARFFEEWFYRNRTNSTKVENLVFMLFGDDYEWNLAASRSVQLLNPNRARWIVIDAERTSPAIDMRTVWSCDHAAISTGTFSWWCGAFNKGIVTYQKEYADPRNSFYEEHEPKDYFLPHWIPL